MGFINNHKENFLQSNSPWGDDNITVYNTPQQEIVEPELRPEDLGYDQINELITQFSEAIPTLNERDAIKLDKKLYKLQEEKQKRDNLEDVTRKERDDSFEFSNTIVEEDVPAAKVVVQPVKEPEDEGSFYTPNNDPTFRTKEQDNVIPLDLDIDNELLDLELQDLLEDKNTPPMQVAGVDNTDNIIMASIIIIAVILITK